MSDERRTRRLCLIALAVLLPVALWTQAHEDVARAWQEHAIEAIDVDARQTTTFAGLNWGLLGVDVTENLKTPAIAEVAVHVQVDLTSKEAVQSLRNCEAYLEDSSGQRWSPLPPKSSEISCSKLSWREGSNGNQVVITERFRVPAARAPEVNLAIVIPKERPRYLRFQRPGQ